jgi:hypothetical protein
MVSELSCLIVTGEQFPEEKLSELLAPAFLFSEFEHASSLSTAFQFLVDSNVNLCLIGTQFQNEISSFLRDMSKLGRDKTCAFVRVLASGDKINSDKTDSLAETGFCASISTELGAKDIQSLRAALSKEVVRMHQEQRVMDIPKYVDMVLKEIDNLARSKQRGMPTHYDKVIASLVKDMMGAESIHQTAFIERLSEVAEHSSSFSSSTVDMPNLILDRKLPQLDKTRYTGRSSRVWNNLLKRYGTKE